MQNERPGGREELAGDRQLARVGASRPHHTRKAVAATGPCRGPRAAEALLVVSAVGERAVGTWILLRTLSSGAWKLGV